MNSPAIGIIGLGIIGSRIAAHLEQSGRTVFVWSRSTRQQENFLPSPKAVAEAVEVIQLFVRDDAALLEAVQDMLPALTPAHVILNHATVSPAATQAAAAMVLETGAAYLDCPFTGSKLAAQNAKLVYYVGGDVAVLERVRPVLEASSSRILHVGDIGHATILKIATNLLTAVTVKGLAEALALTKAHGVEPQQLLASLEPNANFSPLIAFKLPAMIAGDFEAHFSLQNMLKDADFALALAAEKAVSAPALAVMAESMRAALDAGHADKDFSIIAAHS
jgi:3-hydroxyisobutyrate dehydrogenase-like beta-hydroxyacid dehydrogenase